MRHISTALCALVLAMAFSHQAAAGTVNRWTGAVDTAWETNGNWTLGHAPLSTETVVLDDLGGATYTVNLTTTVTVQHLSIGGVTGGGPQTLNLGGGGQLTLNGYGVINAFGKLQIAGSTAGLTLLDKGLHVSGILDHGSGGITGNGSLAPLHISQRGYYNITSGTAKSWNNLDVVNNGHIVHTSATDLNPTGSSLINNHNVDFAGDGGIGGGGLSLTNNGFVLKSAGSVTTLNLGVFSNMNGSIDVFSATELRIQGAFPAYAGSTLAGKSYYVGGVLRIESIGDVMTVNTDLTVAESASMLQKVGGANALTLLNTIDTGRKFTLQFDAVLSVTATPFRNNGHVLVEGTSQLTVSGNYQQNSVGTSTRLMGTLVTPSAQIADGHFTGSGTVSSLTLGGNALLEPGDLLGDTTGTLIVTNTFSMNGGKLLIKLEGISPGEYSTINCNSATVSTGVLAARLRKNYHPVPGGPIDVIVGSVGSSYTFGSFEGMDCTALTFFATAPNVNSYALTPTTKTIKTWNGGTGDFETAGNWSPASVPGPGDTVHIPTGNPTFSGTTNPLRIKDLKISGGAGLTINGAAVILEVKHHVVNGGTIDGTGLLKIVGEAGVEGVLSSPNGNNIANLEIAMSSPSFRVRANTEPGFSGIDLGNLKVSSGQFEIAENQVFIGGNLDVSGGGVLIMNDPAGQVLVNGTANFAGGDTTVPDVMKLGEITVEGAFTTGSAVNQFQISPPFNFRFTGDPLQTVTLGNTQHTFGNVNIGGGGDVRFMEDTTIKGTVSRDGTTLSTAPGKKVTLQTPYFGAGTGPWLFDTTVLDYDGGLSVSGVFQTNLIVQGKVYLTSQLLIDGDITINNYYFDPNGNEIIATGSLSTTGAGVLQQLTGNDLVNVVNASFAGGSSIDQLRAGRLITTGNFSASVIPNSFVATAMHETHLAGNTSTTVSLSAPASQTFNELLIVKSPPTASVTCTTNLTAAFVNFVSGVLDPGRQILTNEFNQAPGNTKLIFDLGGLVPGTDYDQVVTSGSASLAGAVELKVAAGFFPAVGTKFDVISAMSTIVGTHGTESGTTFGTGGVLTRSQTATKLTYEVTVAGDPPPPPPPANPPVITLMTSSKNPEFVNTALTFNGAATQADGHPITFTWDFGDGTPTETGATVTHSFASAADWNVTLTASAAGLSDSRTRVQTILAPNSGGAGVDNVSESKPPHVNILSGISIDVVKSDGGVVELSVDPSGLITREAFDDLYDISTRFTNDKDEDVGTVTGSRPVKKFTESSIYVATTNVEEKAPTKKKGKGRKTIIVSRKEIGGTETKPIKSTAPPSSNSATVTRASGKFILPTDGGATSSKPDTVQITATVELAVGIDLSEPFELSVAIGNIIDTVMIDPKGKVTKATAKGLNSRVKKIKVKLPKRKKGQSPLTVAGEKAVIDVTLSMIGMTTAGFETEGVSRSVDNGMINVQVGILIMGEAYESDIEVEFKKSKNEDSGAIRSAK